MSNNSYEEWKEWKKEDFANTSDQEREYFKKILAPLNLQSNTKILEIGFGNGSFLGFAKTQGYDISGIEILEELTKRANECGFTTFSSVEDIKEEKFDLIVLFDVLEHIEQDQIAGFLKSLNNILTANGHIIVRTPNGNSPFGLSNQYGDMTHCTVVTDAKLHYWSKLSGLNVKYINGDIYPFIYQHKPSKMPSKLIKRFIYILFEKTVRWVLAPQPRGVLSSNLFAILEKKDNV